MVVQFSDLCESSLEAIAWAGDCYVVCNIRALCRHLRTGCHKVHCTYWSEYKMARRRAKYWLTKECQRNKCYGEYHFYWRRQNLLNVSLADLLHKVGYVVPVKRIRLAEEYWRRAHVEAWEEENGNPTKRIRLAED